MASLVGQGKPPFEFRNPGRRKMRCQRSAAFAVGSGWASGGLNGGRHGAALVAEKGNTLPQNPGQVATDKDAGICARFPRLREVAWKISHNQKQTSRTFPLSRMPERPESAWPSWIPASFSSDWCKGIDHFACHFPVAGGAVIHAGEVSQHRSDGRAVPTADELPALIV